MLQTLLPILLIVGAIVGLMLLVSLLARNYITVPPNKVAVFFGMRHGEKGYRVVTGGAKFKWPIIEDVQIMDLSVFQLKISLSGIPNKDNVKINVNAVAICKIKGDDSSLHTAVERFLGKQSTEIHNIILETLEGQLRGVVGTMTVEEIIKDREQLIRKVREEAATELDKIGVGIDILNIQQITDDVGFITALGATRTAEVKRDATIGTANADRDAKQQATTAQKDGSIREAENAALTAEAEKDRDVKKAKYSALVATEQATASQAGPLAKAQAEQGVVVAQVKVDEERQKALIGVQQQMIAIAEKQKEAEIVVPAKKTAEGAVATAEGEKKKAVITSEGAKEATINAATATQKKMELEGAGEASKVKAVGMANADAIRAKLLAEAEGRKAMLMAEADGAKALNEALDKMSDGAVLQMTLNKIPSILEKLPEIVAEIAKPMSAIDKVVIVDAGGSGTGMSKFVNQGPAVLFNLLQTAKEMGFDLEGLLGKVGVKNTGIIEGKTDKKE